MASSISSLGVARGLALAPRHLVGPPLWMTHFHQIWHTNCPNAKICFHFLRQGGDLVHKVDQALLPIRGHSFVHKCCTPLLKSFEVFQNMKHKPSWNQLKWSKTWSKMMRGNPWLNHCDVPKHVVTWCRKMKFNVATDMPATHTHTPQCGKPWASCHKEIQPEETEIHFWIHW